MAMTQLEKDQDEQQEIINSLFMAVPGLQPMPPLPDTPPLKNDEPVLGRQYTVSREEAETQLKVEDEPEVSHTFIKVSHQDYATCEDCGSRVRFYNNPTAHAEMMAHKCENTQLGNGIDG